MIDPGRATDDNMAHAHCVLDTEGYKHIQNMLFLLLLHYSNGYKNAPQCYVIRTWPALSSVLLCFDTSLSIKAGPFTAVTGPVPTSESAKRSFEQVLIIAS
jgi:hypothetical protein